MGGSMCMKFQIREVSGTSGQHKVLPCGAGTLGREDHIDSGLDVRAP